MMDGIYTFVGNHCVVHKDVLECCTPILILPQKTHSKFKKLKYKQRTVEKVWNATICYYLKGIPMYDGSLILKILRRIWKKHVCF